MIFITPARLQSHAIDAIVRPAPRHSDNSRLIKVFSDLMLRPMNAITEWSALPATEMFLRDPAYDAEKDSRRRRPNRIGTTLQ